MWTYWKKPRKAKRPITCYKVLSRNVVDGVETYETPYEKMAVTESVISGKKNLVARGKETHLTSQYSPDVMVTKGYIHCYADKYAAIVASCGTNRVVFKCEIPSGVDYVKEGDGWCHHEICAREIKFLEKV